MQTTSHHPHNANVRGFQRHAILTAFTLSWVFTTAHAQTLDSAIRQALREYPGIKAGNSGVDIARADTERAKGALMPTLSLNASSTSIMDSDADQKPMATPWLAWSVPLNGRVRAEIQRAESAAKVADAKLLVTRDDIALQVSEAWLAVVRGQQMVQLAQQNVSEHSAILGDIQKIVAVDAGRSLDLVQAQVRLDAAQTNLTQRQAELKQAQEKLSRFTSDTGQVVAFGRYPQLPKAVPADSQQALSVMTSPALAQAQAQHEEAQARVQSAKSMHNPTLDLSLGRQFMGVATGAKTVTTVTFSLPIYQGGQVDAGVRSAVAQATAAQDTLVETELVVKERVRLAYADLASAQARLTLAAQQRTSGAKLVSGYKEQFRLARRTLLDLLNIQSEYASYQQAEALAQHDVKAAEYRITAALGQLARSYSAQ
jgi:adhesin transport system outer membrane protein